MTKVSGEKKFIDPYISGRQPLIIYHVRVMTNKLLNSLSYNPSKYILQVVII